VLFNLPEYRVLDAQDDVVGRWALVEPVDPAGHCPDCGFDSSRVHSRPVSWVVAVPIGGRLVVRVGKRRLGCDNVSCDRGTFSQTTDQLGLRARITTRLAGRVVDALAAGPGRCRALLGRWGVLADGDALGGRYGDRSARSGLGWGAPVGA